MRPIPMRFVFEWRLIDGVKDMNARLVAQGTLDKDRRVGVPLRLSPYRLHVSCVYCTPIMFNE